MPATVTPDIIRGTRIDEDDNGLYVTRNYLIENIGPDRGALKEAWESEDFPEYGEPDDDFPELVARQIEVIPFTENSKVKARGKVIFRSPDFSSAYSPVISFISTTREVRSNFDIEGNLILIRYLGPTASGNQTIYTTVGERTAGKSIGILEIERIEESVPQAALNMNDTISSAAWQGKPKWTWYCREVGFRKQLYRAGYSVYYRFEYDREAFIQTLIYRDAFGHVPANIPPVDRTIEVPANPPYGWRNVLRAPPVDYNSLQLPNVFQ